MNLGEILSSLFLNWLMVSLRSDTDFFNPFIVVWQTHSPRLLFSTLRTDELITEQNGSVFSNYFHIPSCYALPAARGHLRQPQGISWSQVRKLRRTENRVSHVPSLKATQTPWLLGSLHSKIISFHLSRQPLWSRDCWAVPRNYSRRGKKRSPG